MSRKNRKADCHPNRRHYALGLCNKCYYSNRPEAPRNKAIRDSQPGLVRVRVPGWGSV